MTVIVIAIVIVIVIRRALAQGVSDHQKMNCQFKYEVEIEQERITTIEQIRTIAQKWTQK